MLVGGNLHCRSEFLESVYLLKSWVKFHKSKSFFARHHKVTFSSAKATRIPFGAFNSISGPQHRTGTKKCTEHLTTESMDSTYFLKCLPNEFSNKQPNKKRESARERNFAQTEYPVGIFA